MNTSATNRRIRVLLTDIRNGVLIPRPEFQRRLVWANKHKVAFIETVLMGLPFPEIYVAAGTVNPETGEAKDMLVDGQQRITTLQQYFTGSTELKLTSNVLSYAKLENDQKIRFLEYEVVVRDLGTKSIDEVMEIFKRINSTNYALNAMEIHNARYAGPFMKVSEEISELSFFDTHRVFSATEIRRIQDVRFVITTLISLLSSYFNRDVEIENYLRLYNDEFPEKDEVLGNVKTVIAFIERCELGEKSRAWQKADLLTLMVEVYRMMFYENIKLNSHDVGILLRDFYSRVDSVPVSNEPNVEVKAYHTATAQASNDRGSRITRGLILDKVLLGQKLKGDE